MESAGIISLFDKIGCGNEAKAAMRAQTIPLYGNIGRPFRYSWLTRGRNEIYSSAANKASRRKLARRRGTTKRVYSETREKPDRHVF